MSVKRSSRSSVDNKNNIPPTKESPAPLVSTISFWSMSKTGNMITLSPVLRTKRPQLGKAFVFVPSATSENNVVFDVCGETENSPLGFIDLIKTYLLVKTTVSVILGNVQSLAKFEFQIN